MTLLENIRIANDYIAEKRFHISYDDILRTIGLFIIIGIMFIITYEFGFDEGMHTMLNLNCGRGL